MLCSKTLVPSFMKCWRARMVIAKKTHQIKRQQLAALGYDMVTASTCATLQVNDLAAGSLAVERWISRTP